MDGWRTPVALLIRVSYVRRRRTSYTCIDIHYTYLSVTNGSEIHQYILKRIFFSLSAFAKRMVTKLALFCTYVHAYMQLNQSNGRPWMKIESSTVK